MAGIPFLKGSFRPGESLGAACILFGMFSLSLGSWGGYSELGNVLGKDQPVFLIGQGLEKGGS